MNKIMDILGFWHCKYCKRWNRKGQLCWYEPWSYKYWEHIWMKIPCKFGKHDPVETFSANESWLSCYWCDKKLT